MPKPIPVDRPTQQMLLDICQRGLTFVRTQRDRFDLLESSSRHFRRGVIQPESWEEVVTRLTPATLQSLVDEMPDLELLSHYAAEGPLTNAKSLLKVATARMVALTGRMLRGELGLLDGVNELRSATESLEALVAPLRSLRDELLATLSNGTAKVEQGPVWDFDTGELFFEGKVVRCYKAEAEKFHVVLNAFQQANWTSYVKITEPFWDDETIRTTVRDMNVNLHMIRFYSANKRRGKGPWVLGVRWAMHPSTARGKGGDLPL